MMNRVEMNDEMLVMVNGGAEIPVVDQNEMLRMPERKNAWDLLDDFAKDLCDAFRDDHSGFVMI